VSVGLVARAELISASTKINLSYTDFCGKHPIAEMLRFDGAAGMGAGPLHWF
jgi:hypothetical protein